METNVNTYYTVAVKSEYTPTKESEVTLIRVKRVNSEKGMAYHCFYTDHEYVEKYKSFGFIVSQIDSEFKGFNKNGLADFGMLLAIWGQIDLKIGNPDFTFEIKK